VLHTNRTSPWAQPLSSQSLYTSIGAFVTNVAGRRADYATTIQTILIPDEIAVDLSQSSTKAAYLGVETGGATGSKYGGRALSDDVIDTDLGVIFGKTLSALGLLTVHFARFQASGNLPERHPSGSLAVVLFQAIDASDGQVIVPLFHYARHAGVFHCPSDDRGPLLSYSVNDYRGGTWASFTMHAVRISQVSRAAQVFVFIEESDPNPKGDNSNSGGFVVAPYPTPVWIDFPAVRHSRGTCLSFLDGHCEYWRWGETRRWRFSSTIRRAPTTRTWSSCRGSWASRARRFPENGSGGAILRVL